MKRRRRTRRRRSWTTTSRSDPAHEAGDGPHNPMTYVYATALTLLNVLLLASILFNLPGAWIMILIALLVEWWMPGEMFTWATLTVAVVLATIGEVLEFTMSAKAARRAGGSRRGAALAIVGGIVGAIIGTPFAPVIGTLLGACVGAFAGSILGDLWAGQPLAQSVDTGSEAAIGRLWGTIAKMVVGSAIVILLAVDAFT
ncbi:MAG: DUF456 domain-containing protein, partial [Pseudomonadota bacterium]